MSGIQRKRSAAWSHFLQTEQKKAKCLYCAQILVTTNGNVGNLTRHLKSKHPSVSLAPERQRIAANINLQQQSDGALVSKITGSQTEEHVPSSTQGASVASSRFQSMINFVQITKPITLRKAELIDEQLMLMIAKEYHPFSIVEDIEFKKLLYMLCPGYTLPTRKTLSESLLPKLYQKKVEIVKTKIQDATAVCLTTDGWTSVNNDSFLAITAHFIQSTEISMSFQSTLLGCIEFNERHTSKNLCDFMKNKIEEWAIRNKITAIASDNAANITAAIGEGGWRHIPCFTHSINLCVQKALTHISATVTNVKAIVEFFKRSAIAQKKLVEMQKQLGLPELKLKQDICTRWNSTYDMLDRCIKIKDAIIATIALIKSDLILDQSDWTLIESVVPILEIFSNITREISAEKNVTLSKVIPLCRIMTSHIKRQRQQQNVQVPIQKLLETLEAELDKRFSHIESHVLYTEATILDPRFEKKAFFSGAHFENALKNLKQKVGTINTPQPAPELPRQEQATTQPSSSTASIWDEFDQEIAQLTPSNTVAADIVEIDKYMMEPMLLRTKDPFVWWHEMRHVYPLLFNYVHRRLNLLATSVPCERIFSKAGYILNERRTRIKSKKLAKYSSLAVMNKSAHINNVNCNLYIDRSL